MNRSYAPDVFWRLRRERRHNARLRAIVAFQALVIAAYTIGAVLFFLAR